MDFSQTIKKTRPWEVLLSAGIQAAEEKEFSQAEDFYRRAMEDVKGNGAEDPRLAQIYESWQSFMKCKIRTPKQKRIINELLN